MLAVGVFGGRGTRKLTIDEKDVSPSFSAVVSARNIAFALKMMFAILKIDLIELASDA